MNRIRIAGLAALLLALSALVAAGCGGASDTKGGSGSSGGSGSKTLSLVAYSTPEVVYDEVIPAFQKTTAGKGFKFKSSYGASGEQSRAVAAGLGADVVTFSLEPDVNKLVDAKLVPADWQKATPYNGFVTTSLVSFIVRKGNPKGIKTWDDLLKPGVDVVTPDPFQSGGAKWNALAGYGARIKDGATADQARAFLKELLMHVAVQPASGREAMTTFLGGKGDVLLAYENEAITAQHAGQPLDYVIPDSTILIENPIAVVSPTKHLEAAQSFVSYLQSTPGQQLWAQLGYRPVDTSVAAEASSQYPTPPGLFTIQDLGGWPSVNGQFFDPNDGVLTQILREIGNGGNRP
jgi:sulfate transport system substrate-binding protein